MKDTPQTLAEVKHLYGIKTSIEEHGLTKFGVWNIFGEDHNADMGGPHSTPFLTTFKGTLEQAILYAVNEVSGFFSWGGGGHFTFNGEATKTVELDTDIRKLIRFINQLTNLQTGWGHLDKIKRLDCYDVYERITKAIRDEDEAAAIEKEVAILEAEKLHLESKIKALRTKK
jgi:hypothetical protein